MGTVSTYGYHGYRFEPNPPAVNTGILGTLARALTTRRIKSESMP